MPTILDVNLGVIIWVRSFEQGLADRRVWRRETLERPGIEALFCPLCPMPP